ncbi:MAG: ThiF family adenylyltransferase, partial [Alistipes sp.]|nr:ThiF family adenylyltransferase [Alistipes sp.]
PDIRLHALPMYLKEEEVASLLDGTLNCQLPIVDCQFDVIVDAIDTIAPKCALIAEAMRRGIPIVSSMGAGAKSDITQIRFADLWDTYHCGLAKAVRTRLKKAGIRKSLPVVFSTEQTDRRAVITVDDERNKKSTAGTISYMPAVFGCYLAEYVIRHL